MVVVIKTPFNDGKKNDLHLVTATTDLEGIQGNIS